MVVDQHFNIINDKLQQLLKQYSRLQKDNERLRAELQEVRLKELQFQEKIDSLNQQISILKVSQGDMSEKDKKAFEKKINAYIKEIDRCISYLSQ
jgi:predicted  nucleic acid-binding Zn-ribbon protein